MKIKEAIVVEGKDDKAAVLLALEANVICTSGYGLNNKIIADIRAAYEKTGIIIFTDPDHAGEEIRKRLTELFPNAKHAFLTQDEAHKNGDIGIENAKPQSIIEAIEKSHAIESESSGEFTMDDMFEMGLSGLPDSAKRRQALGKKLGIGNANTKSFLKKLNYMGITKKMINGED